jgi:hypothetical protein
VAQSLADVARKEQARRKDTAAGKVYTNENLPVVEPTPAAAPARAALAQPGDPDQDDAPPPAEEPAAEAGTGTAEAPAGAAGAGAATAEAAKDEAYWREQMRVEREALQRAESFAEALQSRINALSTDFVNRDDPAQRTAIAADRQKALDELDRVHKEIAAHQKALETIRQEARRAGAPPGWLR